MYLLIKCLERREGELLYTKKDIIKLLDVDVIDKIIIDYACGKRLKTMPPIKKLLKELDEYLTNQNEFDVIDSHSYKVSFHDIVTDVCNCKDRLFNNNDFINFKKVAKKFPTCGIVDRFDNNDEFSLINKLKAVTQKTVETWEGEFLPF